MMPARAAIREHGLWALTERVQMSRVKLLCLLFRLIRAVQTMKLTRVEVNILGSQHIRLVLFPTPLFIWSKHG